ncbi:MAG: hypothetical protein QNI87_04315 [Erythrobacter sp.]|uniref:DUF6702 family protein n=1 Tax=Erythrobacter sp. TaxID=1042 RepID=UPI00261F3EF7|nr:DUF6702 family protein [Erythrobacter sp.]MDJ0977739.1 hypothetical protein [Erythrobacter sp.]
MIRALALMLALLLAVPAAAHEQKVTITTVAHNPRTGLVEVVHRIPLHDAEHALKTQGDTSPDIVNDIASRRAFARYVAERFAIVRDGKPIALTLLGTEIESGRLLVLQEGPSPGRGAEISVLSKVLTDVWARQENRVNLGTGTSVDTLIFVAGDRAKTAVLP